MGKKRARPTVEEVLERPWCYYCERDFDDNIVLTNHQKLKHFKCNKCNRKLNTAGGLTVHMQQVHKETLTEVDNAIEGRRDPSIEVFAMSGIPQELLDAHKQRIMNAFFAMEAEHRARTGNPPAGAGNGQPSSKRVKVEEETPEQLKARLAEHRARRKAEKEAKAAGITLPDQVMTDAQPTVTETTNQQAPAVSQPPFTFEVPFRTQIIQPAVASIHATTARFLYQILSIRTKEMTLTNQPMGSPLQHNTHPGQGMVGQPGFPPPFPPQGFPQGFPPNMAGPPVFPPQHSPYNMPPYGPPAHHSPMPAAPLHSPMTAVPRHSPRPGPIHTHGNGFSPPADGPSRQNSLPSAPGLPARPSFNSPNLSREEMQRMHEGQGPPAPKTGAYTNTYQPPPQQPPQAATPQQQQVAPEMMQSVADLIQSVKDELKEKAEKERQEKEQAAAKQTKIFPLDGAAEAEDAGAPNKPNVLPLSKPKKSKKTSKDATAKLVFDDNGTWISPEEKMATLSKYAFTRQNGAEYTLSEGGGAVTGTERGENDVVDPVH